MKQTHSKSEAHKQKLREAARRRYTDPQERQRQADRMSKLYQENPSLQKMNGDDAARKRGSTLKDKWQTPEYREHILASRNTPEVKQKLHDASVRQWSEQRETLVEAIRASRYVHIDQEHFHDPEWIRSTNEQLTLTEIADILGCSQSCMSRQFAKFGIVPKQHPIAYTGGETQIKTFIESVGVTEIRQRDRSIIPPVEIDLYLPNERLGIEYHGCFWHSYNRRETADERRRHENKHIAAMNVGIRLLQFWDVEWAQHPLICQNLIQSALKKNHSIGARTCDIRTPRPSDVSTFLSTYHLQGPRPYTYARGLYHQNELVMVMTIGKSRFKSGSWELLRLATKSGLHISGGGTKLWSELRQLLPASCEVYSYADKRLFQGSVYSTLGFTWSHDTPPGYQYWRDGQLYSRLAFQKHKLASLPGYVDTLTEAENMFHWGYRRVWDAGQSVWVYRT